MYENIISVTYGAGRPRQRPRLRVTGPLSIDAMTKILKYTCVLCFLDYQNNYVESGDVVKCDTTFRRRVNYTGYEKVKIRNKYERYLILFLYEYVKLRRYFMPNPAYLCCTENV